MAKLKKGQRRRLPSSSFAYPAQRKYPIQDKPHARAALSRAASSRTSGSYAHVAAAVNRRYPGMAKGRTKKRAKRSKSSGRSKRRR